MFQALDFFAGSGLVRVGLEPEFETVWANDNCPKKRAAYEVNHTDDCLCPLDIADVKGADLPVADLAWASFPCQDLSLAGNLDGIRFGTRSGLFWQWIRVLGEMKSARKLPPLLIAENVVGFVVAHNGKHFKLAYEALRKLGYRIGAVLIDAELFLPQSRPRAFVIAVRETVDLRGLIQSAASEPFHSSGLVRTALA